MIFQRKIITPKFYEFGINTMQRAIIIAKGDVQRAGYRDVVEGIARKLGLVGYVENLKPYDVRIVVEGEKEQLENLIEKIKITDDPLINVEDVIPIYEKPTGEFEYFEIRRGPYEEENAERLDLAAKHLKGVARNVKTMDTNLGGKIDNVGNKVDNVGEKVDGVGNKVDALREETRQGFSKTDQNFTTLRQDYGKISQTMEKILESMDNTSKKTEKVLEILAQQQQEFTNAINGQTKAILKLAEKSG